MQNVYSVDFTVTQVWNTEASTPLAVTLPGGGCSFDGAVDAMAVKEYTATCTNGFAEVNIAVGDFVTSCDAVGMGSTTYTVSIPCVPVCYPEIPNCLDGPIVDIADTGDLEICHYADSPIMVQSMNDDFVDFKIDNTWTGISTIAVSYADANGNPACHVIDNPGPDFESTAFTAKCGPDMMAQVTIAVHAGLDALMHTADGVSCSPTADVGTCTYEYVVPCGASIMCKTPTVSPTSSPTVSPTSSPTDPIVSNTVFVPQFPPPGPEECTMDYTVGSSSTVCGPDMAGVNVVTLQGTVGVERLGWEHGEGIIYDITFDSTKGTVTFDVANPFSGDAITDIYVKHETGSSVQGFLEPTCAAMPGEAICVEPTTGDEIEVYCRDAGYAIVYVYFATTDVNLVTTDTATINDCCYPSDVASFDYASGGKVIELAYKIDCSCPVAAPVRKLLRGN
jgi:hypothetical protein